MVLNLNNINEKWKLKKKLKEKLKEEWGSEKILVFVIDINVNNLTLIRKNLNLKFVVLKNTIKFLSVLTIEGLFINIFKPKWGYSPEKKRN